MTILVVSSAFLRIGKHLVGFLGFLEFLLGDLAGAALVAVRVMLHRQLAVGFFDVLIAGVFRNAQRVVVIFFDGHGNCVFSGKDSCAPDAAKRNAGKAPDSASLPGGDASKRQSALLDFLDFGVHHIVVSSRFGSSFFAAGRATRLCSL